jgi:F-type H+-transporting ATPase subunit b
MHEPVLVPDFTIFIQVALFFASYFVLSALVYRPYLALLKARREQTVGLLEQAEQDRTQAEKLRVEYEALMKVERKKISAWSDEERKKVQEEERLQTQSARDVAAKASEASREVRDKEKKSALKSLESSVNEFSSAIVSKMLGRKVQVTGAPLDKTIGSENTVRT